MSGGPQTQKNSLMVGKSAGTEKDLHGDQRRMQYGLWKAGQSKNCRQGLHCSSAHSRIELPVVKRSWALESRLWSRDPGKAQLLAVKIQTEGTGVRSPTTGKVSEKA